MVTDALPGCVGKRDGFSRASFGVEARSQFRARVTREGGFRCRTVGEVGKRIKCGLEIARSPKRPNQIAGLCAQRGSFVAHDRLKKTQKRPPALYPDSQCVDGLGRAAIGSRLQRHGDPRQRRFHRHPYGNRLQLILPGRCGMVDSSHVPLTAFLLRRSDDQAPREAVPGRPLSRKL